MDKSFVSPFLFDIRRSEVDGPILQFQSTIFETKDLKKLVKTLNKACDEDGLPNDRLDKAFDVWYPTLEDELTKLKSTPPESTDDGVGTELQSPKVQEILEEVLDLSRNNQKLLRNPDSSLSAKIEELNMMIRDLIERPVMAGGPLSGDIREG